MKTKRKRERDKEEKKFFFERKRTRGGGKKKEKGFRLLWGWRLRMRHWNAAVVVTAVAAVPLSAKVFPSA